MFNVDGMSGQNRDMTREALEIILRMWTEDAPWTHKGKFWTVTKPDTMFDFLKPHIKPLQAPHPPIGVAGLSKGSDTLKLAGERGYIPMSLNLNPAYVGSHWDSVEAGAARTGRKPNRQDWRLVREVFVADTDEEAWKLSAGDMMGRMMGEYFLPLLGHFGFKDYLKTATSPWNIARVTIGSSARPRRWRKRSRPSIARSAVSARSWCLASTTSTSRKPGITLCGC
jgi:alkanesulfonate monooxygenase SsuD/methylene tetrahydromethanopterin reductase-like flavin-dependent oxidoreductase (luciferase family)